MTLTWSHAVMYVRDEARMLDFYSRVLGFEETDQGMIRGDTMRIIFLSQSPDEHHQLAFIPIREGDEPSNSVDHFAFRIDDLDALRGMISTLREEDVSFRPVTHGNTWSVYFSDPENNGIEIFCDTPWHVQQPTGITWDTEQADEALRQWTLETFNKEPTFGPNTLRGVTVLEES